MHGPDDGELIDILADAGEDFADFDAAFAALVELEGGAEEVRLA
jgi:hypothetical protein